jgi:hypothetical protein
VARQAAAGQHRAEEATDNILTAQDSKRRAERRNRTLHSVGEPLGKASLHKSMLRRGSFGTLQRGYGWGPRGMALEVD